MKRQSAEAPECAMCEGNRQLLEQLLTDVRELKEVCGVNAPCVSVPRGAFDALVFIAEYVSLGRGAVDNQPDGRPYPDAAARAASEGGWQIFDDGRWPGYVTPADLARRALVEAAP